MLTRRGILQRAAAVVGLVGAAEVSGIIRLRPSSEKSPPRPVKPPQNREYPNVRGLYSKRQVNVCYAPVRIVRGEPEARRGRQLHPGDVVRVGEIELQVGRVS